MLALLPPTVLKIFGIRAKPDDSGKNESIYPPRSKSVGLCFVCTQRKVGLLCYLQCCLSKAHTSASLFPQRANKGLLFFHRGAFLNSEFRHVGHGWIDPYEKKALHLQGSPLAEIFFSFLKNFPSMRQCGYICPRTLSFFGYVHSTAIWHWALTLSVY